MSRVKICFLIATLIACVSVLADGQANFTRREYTVDTQMVNAAERLARERSNQELLDSVSKKDADLTAERMIRDRKIELDTQLTVDTAKIQKQAIDLDALAVQKSKLLAASQKQYERELDQYKQSIRVSDYQLPSEDWVYTVTITDDTITTDAWIELFVKAKDGSLMPFYTFQYYFNVTNRVVIAQGKLTVTFRTDKTASPLASKMKAPLGLILVVYVQK
jgi:hypothetical protein